MVYEFIILWYFGKGKVMELGIRLEIGKGQEESVEGREESVESKVV